MTCATPFVVRCLIMATFSSVMRQHVLQALAEHDARGGDEFLDTYGFGPLPGYALLHEGHSYDVRAVMGVAHRFATGRLATSDEFSNGMDGPVAILRKRGFEVSEPAVPARPTPVRSPRAPRTPQATRSPRTSVTRATAAREATVAICPTCSMTLPATGVCDYCS